MKPVPITITMEANEYGLAMLLFGGVIQAEQLAAAGIRGEELNEVVAWACRVAEKPPAQSWPEFAEMMRKIAKVQVHAVMEDNPPVSTTPSKKTPVEVLKKTYRSANDLGDLFIRKAREQIKYLESPSALMAYISDSQRNDFRETAGFDRRLGFSEQSPEKIEHYAVLICAEILFAASTPVHPRKRKRGTDVTAKT